MTCIPIQPRHHFLVPKRWIVNGVGYSIELAHMASTLGYGSNQPQQQ
jgi:hypothetical protein